jgi:predicted nucleic-acid-binding protein
MIGIDTNLLLRLLLDDDQTQSIKINALMDAHATLPESVMIIDVVLAETIWTLRTVYEQPKSAQVAALKSLLAQPAFQFENRHALADAIANFSNSNAGFSDCLIAAKLTALGCDFSATFDKKMRTLPGIKVL